MRRNAWGKSGIIAGLSGMGFSGCLRLCTVGVIKKCCILIMATVIAQFTSSTVPGLNEGKNNGNKKHVQLDVFFRLSG